MTQNLDLNNDPNNESPFGLVYAEDSAFGPPIRLEPHEVSSVEVPPYGERVRVLLGDAHMMLLALEERVNAVLKDMRSKELTFTELGRELPQVQRWLDRYELHLCQIDYPDLRHERPLSVPFTVDGEVKDDANARG